MGQIYSFNYKMEKSNPKFFQRLLEELHSIREEQMVLIDDSESKIVSASECGIKGILYKNIAQVECELLRMNK